MSWQNVLRNFTILLDRKMKDTTKQLVSEALELVLTNISKHKAEKKPFSIMTDSDVVTRSCVT